jgi:aldehyde dehydrogenase (NAD+)
LDASIKCLKTFYGDDIQKSDDFARIISQAHCERLKTLLEGNPGQIITGGQVDVSDRYVAPTIVDVAGVDSSLMADEIFGPILPVMQYENIDDAIEIINSESLCKPLALYIFSKDRQLIDKVIDACPSGGVVVNDTIFHVLNPYMPFGGVGTSGMGGYHG